MSTLIDIRMTTVGPQTMQNATNVSWLATKIPVGCEAAAFLCQAKNQDHEDFQQTVLLLIVSTGHVCFAQSNGIKRMEIGYDLLESEPTSSFVFAGKRNNQKLLNFQEYTNPKKVITYL